MAQSNAIVTTRGNCPFCNSSARREIDLLIHARHFYNPENDHSGNGDADKRIVSETGEFVDLSETAPNDTYEQTLDEIKGMLEKIPGQNTNPFDLTDLLIHSTNHLAVNVVTPKIKSEGAILFVGDKAYQTPDTKDVLRLIINKSIEQIESGEMKLTPKQLMEAVALLWRMTGDSGNNEFLEAMHNKVTTDKIASESPLGSAYSQRESALGKRNEIMAQKKNGDSGS